MTTRVRVLLIVVVSVVLIVGVMVGFLFFYEVREFLKQDRCLDRGGRWNAEQGVCEYVIPAHGLSGSGR